MAFRVCTPVISMNLWGKGQQGSRGEKASSLYDILFLPIPRTYKPWKILEVHTRHLCPFLALCSERRANFQESTPLKVMHGTHLSAGRKRHNLPCREACTVHYFQGMYFRHFHDFLGKKGRQRQQGEPQGEGFLLFPGWPFPLKVVYMASTEAQNT